MTTIRVIAGRPRDHLDRHRPLAGAGIVSVRRFGLIDQVISSHRAQNVCKLAVAGCAGAGDTEVRLRKEKGPRIAGIVRVTQPGFCSDGASARTILRHHYAQLGDFLQNTPPATAPIGGQFAFSFADYPYGRGEILRPATGRARPRNSPTRPGIRRRMQLRRESQGYCDCQCLLSKPGSAG